MDKHEVAAVLSEIARLLELKGENPFKARAYENAAHAIETLEDDLDKIVAAGKLDTLKGVGKNIAARVTEMVTSGQLAYLEDLRSQVPHGLLEILTLSGLGPKKIRTIYELLGVETIETLEAACLNKKIEQLEGFGALSEENILSSIANFKRYKKKFRFNLATAEAEKLRDYLRSASVFKEVTIAGSLRRCNEITKDIDLLATAFRVEEAMTHFLSYPEIHSVFAQGETKSSVKLNSGLNADLRIVEENEFPYALAHFTGSKEHNIAMRQRAKEKYKLKMNEYGLFTEADNRIECVSEAEIFAKLGLAYIPPQMREDRGEIEAAEKGELPTLINRQDLCGIIHAHTSDSDGHNSLEDMVEEARRLGFSYLGISEHSQSAGYAHGLKEDRLKETWEKIEKLNEQQGDFKIFKGIESDIRADGSLDYPADLLSQFDFVIASVHSGFSMEKEQMTRRVIKALENEYTTILGHPTGRLLLIREPVQINMKMVVEAAAGNGKVIELNTNPMRLDIDWRELHYAKKLGVKIALCPDAHKVEGLANIYWGIGIAQKGWLEKTDVINCLDTEEISNYFKGLRDGN